MSQDTNETEAVEQDDDPDLGWGPIPNTVLLPAIIFIVGGCAAIAAACIEGASSTTTSMPWMLPLVGGLAAVGAGVGLFRHSRIAHTVAYLLGGLAVLTGVGIIPGVGVIWSLSVRSAKDWFNIR